MEWLTPMTALYAAAATVPLLLLLYFLKLKRREQFVSSTFLWKRAVQDLQVNAPFQRIRRNILLLLQLLMLLAVLLALAAPILAMTGGPARRYVLLIDRSASMSAEDGGEKARTRLQNAKEQAAVFVRSLRDKSFFSLSPTGDQVMVIAFDAQAKVMCNYTSDKPQILAAIEAITPGHERSTLSQAVTVARAFAQSPGIEANNRSAEQQAQLILYSDGRIDDLDRIVVSEDEMTFHCVGKSGNNVAVTAMQARRAYENPDQVNVFATIANYSNETVTTDVQLSLDGDIRTVRSVTIAPRNATGASDVNRPGKVAVNFSLLHSDAAVLEVRQLHHDELSCDDAAWAVLAPPKKLSALLVTRGNVILESSLRACPLAGFKTCSPAEFDAMDHDAMAVEQPYDVIILDNYSPAKLPRCRYLVFGKPPADINVSVPGQLKNQVVVDWQMRHSVLKYVNLTNLFAAKCYRMVLPRDAEVLAEFNATPAIAVVRRNASVFLLAGFDILETNWPFEPSFVLFCFNAVGYLGTELGDDRQGNLQVGQPIVVEAVPPGTVAKVHGPDAISYDIQANPSGTIRLPQIDRLGVYRLSIPGRADAFFAANLLDVHESNIEPVRKLVLAGQPVEAQHRPFTRANLPLWPFLVGIALVLACLEWLVYNSKVRI